MKFNLRVPVCQYQIFIVLVIFSIVGCNNAGRDALNTTKEDVAGGISAEQSDVGVAPEAGEETMQRPEEATEFETFLESAVEGDAEAQYQVGERYREGNGIPIDLPKAVEWFTKAAEQGNAGAQYCIGQCYANGEGVAQDTEKADEWFRKAAEQFRKDAEAGDAEAQIGLAKCYFLGEGVEQDKEKAVEWRTRAAEQGNAHAQYSLGQCYYNGEGVEQDKEKAVEWFTKAAEQGNAGAQYSLGQCYANGEGVAQDTEKADEWFRKAAEQFRKDAEQGDILAQHVLGWCYENGKGIEQDKTQAIEWYRKALENGIIIRMGVYEPVREFVVSRLLVLDERATLEWIEKEYVQSEVPNRWMFLEVLGKCYASDEGVEKDEEKAFEYFLRAAMDEADRNNISVANRYASEYNYSFWRFPEDKEKAVVFWNIGASCGDAEAQDGLGQCYAKGEGVEQNKEKAVEWRTKAAEQGRAWAQYGLALWYADGEVVEQDKEKAVEWFTKAAEQGNAHAQYSLGQCYANGEGVEQNKEKAVEWYTKAAEQEHGDALDKMGRCYANGEGVEQNKAKAIEWYRKDFKHNTLGSEALPELLSLDEAGTLEWIEDEYVGNEDFHSASALHLLGMCYAEGEGIEKNDDKAFEYFLKAAENHAECNHSASIINIFRYVSDYDAGVDYFPKDKEKAAVFVQIAAELGDAGAQCHLGWRYGFGEGVEQDKEKAVEWYTKAAAQGNARAQYNLGACYANGDGILQDYRKAMRWYRAAAAQGVTDAVGNIARSYRSGQGVVQDYIEAYAWYLQDLQGELRAKRDALAQLMTQEQIVQAQSRAKELKVELAETEHSSGGKGSEISSSVEGNPK